MPRVSLGGAKPVPHHRRRHQTSGKHAFRVGRPPKLVWYLVPNHWDAVRKRQTAGDFIVAQTVRETFPSLSQTGESFLVQFEK